MRNQETSFMNRFVFKTVGLAIVQACMFSLATVSSVGAADKSITLAVGKMEILDVQFAITGFRVADPGVAKGELLSGRKMSIVGLKTGTSDLQVTGKGGEEQTYAVNVINDVQMLLGAMRMALNDVPEVEMSANLGRVLIKGEISNLGHWNTLKNVVAAYGKGAVMDLTTLRMPPELVLRLREGLKKAGFEIAKDNEDVGDSTPGRLSVEGTGRTIYVKGRVFSTGDIAKIESVVAAQHWLTMKPKEGEVDDGDEATYTGIINVSVVPVMLEVDVTFLAITDEDQQKLGVNLLSAGLLTIEGAGALAGDALTTWSSSGGSETVDGVKTLSPNTVSRTKSRSYDNSGTYSVAADLAGTLNFYISKHPDRLIEKAHFTFKNDAVDWKEYHSGGTLKIRIVSDNASDIEDIDYGLIMKVKGGLLDADNISLDMNVELSAPEEIAGTADYDLKRERIETSLNCPIGHAVIMGGMNKLLEGVDESATPILRSVPVLKHLFSEKASSRIEKRLLVLMSCHVVGTPRPAIPVSEETLKLLEETKTPAKKRERKNKRRFFFF